MGGFNSGLSCLTFETPFSFLWNRQRVVSSCVHSDPLTPGTHLVPPLYLLTDGAGEASAAGERARAGALLDGDLFRRALLVRSVNLHGNEALPYFLLDGHARRGRNLSPYIIALDLDDRLIGDVAVVARIPGLDVQQRPGDVLVVFERDGLLEVRIRQDFNWLAALAVSGAVPVRNAVENRVDAAWGLERAVSGMLTVAGLPVVTVVRFFRDDWKSLRLRRRLVNRFVRDGARRTIPRGLSGEKVDAGALLQHEI